MGEEVPGHDPATRGTSAERLHEGAREYHCYTMKFAWWAPSGSNRRPADLKGDQYPLSLTAIHEIVPGSYRFIDTATHPFW